MKVTVTVYRDNNGLYPEGAKRVIDGTFTFGERGYISLVDYNDGNIDLSKPHKDVLSLSILGGQTLYVGDTVSSILAQMDNGSTGGGSVSPVSFKIGDGNPNTPADGTNTYINVDMVGKQIVLQKNGLGSITAGTGENQYQRNAAGLGEELTLQDGSVFSDGETYQLWIIS